jgi:hypothetical protein
VGWDVLYDEIELSLDTLRTVWFRENLGDMHTTLVDTAYWLNEDDRRDALGSTSGELAKRGLLAGRDLLPDFRETLEVLARPTVEFYGWLATAEEQHTVLVAAYGRDAVLVTRQGSRVRLGPARPDGLVETLVGQLPPTPAAKGRSVNLPESGVRALAAVRGDAPAGQARPLRPDAYAGFGRASEAEDAQELLEVLEQPRTAAGELYVAVRTPTGERRRCRHHLNYVDTEQGRWMTQLSGDRPGDGWLVAAPASRQLLISKLQEMRKQLQTWE